MIFRMQKPASVSLFASQFYMHMEKKNILISVLNVIFFLFYDVNLNTQVFVSLECVKYQLGLRRNMPVFTKYNVYISAIQFVFFVLFFLFFFFVFFFFCFFFT